MEGLSVRFDSILFPESVPESLQEVVQERVHAISRAPIREAGDSGRLESVQAPPFFHDLNLDRIVEAVTAGWKQYDLAPFYYTRLSDLDAILYRQEVMKDLEEKPVMEAVRLFSKRMHSMRERLDEARELGDYKYSGERRFMIAVETYCQAVDGLLESLSEFKLNSRGLRAFRDYLSEYLMSDDFADMVAELEKLKSDISAVRYCLLLRNGSVTVRPYNSEPDYSAAVEETFAKFRHGTARSHSLESRRWMGMNHIEAQVLDRVALLYPDTFRALDAFYEGHRGYLNRKIARFDREIQFYVAYLAYIDKCRGGGLTFCIPRVSKTSKEISGREVFDLALAGKLAGGTAAVVPNDFFLTGPERVFVVSGPNHGGKTTFARTIGQLHYLAALGCPVPGTEVRLFLFDHLFTHFEQEEDITSLRGKLQSDLVRIRQILEQATPQSVIVMNEMFSSTTLKDAVYLSKKVMDEISRLDLLGVWVTFLDELSSLNEKTVSMVSAVDPQNPAIRTYKLGRRPADGLAYALAIAQKYHVTYDRLKERIKA